MVRGPAPPLWLVLAICLLSFGPPGVCVPATGEPGSTWPHTLMENGAVTVYQPQAISWPDQKTLTARAAVAITPPGAARPLLGTIEVALATTIDKAADVVMLSEPRLIATHFPSLNTDQATQLEARIRAALPRMPTREVPLDAVLLSLKEVPATAPVAVNNEPPVIFYANHPASLVVFDGEPVLAPVGKTGLSYAVNANWDIFSDGKQWYLLNNGLWLVASSFSGPYAPASRLPPAFDAIPNEPNFAEIHKHIPAQPPKPGTPVPAIFVSTKPAEIIVTAGSPQFAPVKGTSLQSVTNTASPLFVDSTNGRGAEGAGYRGVNGNRGGAVRTSSGDVYAGRDGNVYQHSSNGWSKWDNGAWTPTQPAATKGATRQQSANIGSTQQSRRYGQNQSLDRTSYNQLQRDRQARLAGERNTSWRQGRTTAFRGQDRFDGGGERFRR